MENYKDIINEELKSLADSRFAKLTDSKLAVIENLISLKKTEDWKDKISKAHKGKTVKSKTIEKLKSHPNAFGNKDAWNKGLVGYKTKPHSAETKNKMSEKAKGRIITDAHKIAIKNKLSIPIIAYEYPSMKFYKEYSSQTEAAAELNLTGILHVLKKRSKQCGGYYFEYSDTI
jgi:hypothetical protein